MAILVCIYGLLYIYLSLYTNIFYPILSLVYMYNTIHYISIDYILYMYVYVYINWILYVLIGYITHMYYIHN